MIHFLIRDCLFSSVPAARLPACISSSTALLALYGFKSGYLLASNGVVVSMFLAHFFVIFEIFLITRIRLPQKIAEGIAGKL